MIRLATPASTDFSRFGRWIEPPAEAGTRLDLTYILTPLGPETIARAQVNHVRPSTLPLSVAALEHHPRAWQAFMPLDVAEYVVVVAGRRADGLPNTGDLHAFRVPGTVGVAYAPGVWHMGSTVLHRVGHFTVLWPREPSGPDGGPGDTIVTRLEPAPMVGDA
jgi:ureidoglycolate lyase